MTMTTHHSEQTFHEYKTENDRYLHSKNKSERERDNKIHLYLSFRS